MSIVQVQALHVTYPARAVFFGKPRPPIRAVNEVSFDIPTGTTFGLVGESGSGKSSLARALLRLTPYQAGHISLHGQEVAHLSGAQLAAYRQQVQVVFQDNSAALNPTFTVGDIVGELLTRHRGLRGTPRRVEVQALLQQVGLEPHLIGRYPHELSGGQRQRVGIARALAVQPQLLICDEATSALDVSVQSQVINLLEDIQAQTGLTMLFIAHDLEVVRHLSDNVGLLYLGYMVEQGPTERVFTAPAHPYTEMLLLSIPIANPHEQRRRAQQRQAVTLPAEPPSPARLPKGCPYQARCPFALPVCADEMPAPTPVHGGGSVRCHLHTSGPRLNGASVRELITTTR